MEFPDKVFEVGAENFTQMEFSEVRINQEIELQNDEKREADFPNCRGKF